MRAIPMLRTLLFLNIWYIMRTIFETVAIVVLEMPLLA